MDGSNDRLDAFWMPFTAGRQFRAAPRMLTGAKGVHYTTEDGREILDGTGGLWCCNAGHGHREVADAVHEQLLRLDYAPAFQMGHPIAFDFARRIAGMAPEGLDHVFFSGSGSEAVETALKVALAYHKARGEGTRTRFIGRERAYHGVGFGGIAVGGIVNNRRHFAQIVGGVDHLPHTHAPEHNAFSRGQPAWGAHLAEDLERLVALHGAETIAAVIVEPVAGATGVLPPPVGYLERLREICTAHGILLIFDEVVTGFGRLGTPFAADYFGVTPDMMTLAKGITSGTVPMGATIVSGEIRRAFEQGPEHVIEFFHGYTYSGHPAACAAGMAIMDIYARDDVFARAAALAPHWQAAIHGLRDAPHVRDIRNLGLLGAVELEPRATGPGTRGYDVFVDAFHRGGLIRAAGDVMVLSPPLTISAAQVDELFAILRASLEAVA
ncbi:Omega-amino acid--pyruvate aminotransferase [Jannaschia seosinensis]|uniref:Omega-amino acid--pyruvate aminotransferase n=1 Tax=Jannaschia seosinensis TaxID=313367 RepID=A0A0M7BD59_9RHOB|nr:aspartate aminotransferase family protein [Jannaschia seosinensis]CUH40008.1 Omega-amino acid--pyruvate aminotransferase [Jannaschia seosinensis]